MSIKMIEPFDFTTPALYHQWWGLVTQGGQLYAVDLDADDEASAAAELAAKGEREEYAPVAVCRVGHTAYNIVPPDFKSRVARRLLEHAAPLLGINYAEAK